MNRRKSLVIAVLFTFCLTVSVFSVIPVSSSGTYDPWLDSNDDGKIDLKDYFAVGKAYGTSGDPTKNVTVANWPKSEDVLIWYQDELADGAYQYSPHYYSNGYSTIHMRMYVGGLAVGEAVTFWVIAPLWNANRTSYYPIPAYTHIFNSTDVRSALTIDVPSDEFYFGFDAAAGTSCIVSLAFYLTWA